ncbi:hypothetical protein D3C83_07090 [compost metagenome]
MLGSLASCFNRFFCCFFERWNQNLSSSTPSSHSIFSIRWISEIRRSYSAALMCPMTRFRMGSVCQAPKKMPIRPLGGSARQKRHMGGRSASSSDARWNAFT